MTSGSQEMEKGCEWEEIPEGARETLSVGDMIGVGGG